MAETEHELSINKTFAQKFNKNNQKKELSRKNNLLQEEFQQESHSDSESEDEDANLLTPEMDKNLNELVKMIRNNDPKLINGSENIQIDNQNSIKEKLMKKPQKKTISEVVCEQILSDGKNESKNEKRGINEESGSELKEEFLKAAKTDDAQDGDFFEETEEINNNLPKQKIRQKKSEGNKFLDDFFEHQYWKGTEDKESLPTYKSFGQDGLEDVSDDEEELLKQDEFESNYNFRYQDPEGSRLVSYSRNQNDTIRKKESSRKKKREAKKLQRQKEIQKKKEEVRKLRKIQQDQIKKKISQIEEVAGVKVAFNAKDLEGDFDGEEFNKKMSQIFNKDYFEKEENLEGINEEKKGNDRIKTSGKGKLTTKKDDKISLEEKQAVLAEKFKDIESQLDSYKKLPAVETIGKENWGGFKYIKVKPKNYGLSGNEILTTDDKKLTQKISIKFLATYRDGEEADEFLNRKNNGAEPQNDLVEVVEADVNETSQHTKDKFDNRFVRSEKIVKKLNKQRKQEKQKDSKTKNQKNPKKDNKNEDKNGSKNEKTAKIRRKKEKKMEKEQKEEKKKNAKKEEKLKLKGAKTSKKRKIKEVEEEEKDLKKKLKEDKKLEKERKKSQKKAKKDEKKKNKSSKKNDKK